MRCGSHNIMRERWHSTKLSATVAPAEMIREKATIMVGQWLYAELQQPAERANAWWASGRAAMPLHWLNAPASLVDSPLRG